MRVAIVGKYPLDTARIQGGLQAAFSYLVDGLRQFADLDLHVLTINASTTQQFRRVEQDGLTIHVFPSLPRLQFIKDYDIYQAWLDEALAHIQPHVVHAQGAAQDAYVALRSRYPAVITVHGIPRETGKYLSSFVLRLRSRIFSARIEQYNLRQTQHLIVISRYVTRYFASILKPETRVYFIPNAVHHRFFELEDAGDGHTLLFAGRVIPCKHLIDLVQAFARLSRSNPEAQLRIAGEYRSDARYAEAVRIYIRRAGLNEQVHLLGPLPETKVLDEFARCDVLVLPSVQETAPMVIAQAMAAGKSVVATAVGGIPEMVEDGFTGLLVKVGDIEGLANALQRLLQDPSLRTKMGQAGKTKAIANYHATTVARRTLQVYQSIATER